MGVAPKAARSSEGTGAWAHDFRDYSVGKRAVAQDQELYLGRATPRRLGLLRGQTRVGNGHEGEGNANSGDGAPAGASDHDLQVLAVLGG